MRFNCQIRKDSIVYLKQLRVRLDLVLDLLDTQITRLYEEHHLLESTLAYREMTINTLL